ncbi:hypothetical protein PINS_up023641 [Pythium insidiosum]|nr:hypothetical protein PINS_up023641 [Pythium insidiosum]
MARCYRETRANRSETARDKHARINTHFDFDFDCRHGSTTATVVVVSATRPFINRETNTQIAREKDREFHVRGFLLYAFESCCWTLVLLLLLPVLLLPAASAPAL